MTVPQSALEAFGLRGRPRRLSGGSAEVYCVGRVVLKRLHRTSLENQHSLELVPWLAEQLTALPEDGFRLSRPLRTHEGGWLSADGWTAWTFLEGRPVTARDVPAAIEAIRRLHELLRPIAPHPLLAQNETAWGYAHRHCFGERPSDVHPLLADLVDRLYARWRPLPGLPGQLIHGDLCPGNVLIAPGCRPGLIDLTPFVAPADFALAMFANWIGPRQGDAAVLRHFAGIAHFGQLLLRAAIRMLLVVSHLEGVEGWERAPEKRAAEIVLAFLDRQRQGP